MNCTRIAFVSCCSLALLAGLAVAQQPSIQPTKPTDLPMPGKDGKLEKMSPEQLAKVQQQIKSMGGDAAAAGADPTKEEPVDPANPAAQVVFDKAEHQLGVIGDDGQVEFEFKFTNKGNKTLEFLGQPTGSCGCTVPNLEKLTYEPGESGVIKGKYDPKHRNGPQHTQVTVRTNDPKKPELKLHVKSEVRPIFRVDPQFLNVGQVDRNVGANTSFKIISRREDIKVTQVTPTSPRVKAEMKPTVAVVQENGETVWETPVDLVIDGKAGVGQLNENIQIRSSDPARTISTVVMGEVLGDITLSPNQLSLPGLTPGQAVNNSFKLTSRNGQPFRVLKVEEVSQRGAAPFMKFEAKEDVGSNPQSWTVTITGNAPAQQGTLQGEIVTTTDNPNDPQMRMRYFGFVRAAQQPQPAAAPKDPWADKPSLLQVK